MTFQDIKGRYKQIDGFPDYFISELGEVYSQRLRGNEIEHRLRKLTPKNPGKSSKYYNVILCNDDGQITAPIHKLVAKYFVDGYYDGAVVNHIDGDNRNNIATNLEWTTVQDNIHKSYITSGVGPTRNYKVWELYDPDGVFLGSFIGFPSVARYIISHKLDASPSQLQKMKNSRGFTVRISNKRIGNCNDYPQGVAAR